MLKPAQNHRPVLKNSREIALMREAGQLVGKALTLAHSKAQPGAKTIHNDHGL